MCRAVNELFADEINEMKAVLADKEDAEELEPNLKFGDISCTETYSREKVLRLLMELNDGFEIYGDGERTACIVTIENGKCIKVETEDDIFQKGSDYMDMLLMTI